MTGLDFGMIGCYQDLPTMIGFDILLTPPEVVIVEQTIILLTNGKMILMSLMVADGKKKITTLGVVTNQRLSWKI